MSTPVMQLMPNMVELASKPPIEYSWPIYHCNIPVAFQSKYSMWDGEAEAIVIQHRGFHGFWSASITVVCADDPCEVYSYSGYKFALNSKSSWGAGKIAMQTWVAKTLNNIATCNAGALHGTSPVMLVYAIGNPQTESEEVKPA